MSPKLNLNKRQQQILWATVRHYISTAEPVSSKALSEEYNLKVSSATIRNAMGLLEKSGLLYQPHTSAGRIPSDSGYRVYVDRLIAIDEVYGQQIEHLLAKELDWEKRSLEALFRGATQILATLSGYIALITLPQNATARLKHLQLVSISASQIMLIMVTDAYQTQSVLIDLPSFPSEERKAKIELTDGELQILSNFLNSKLKGRALSELTSLDWSELDREFESYASILKTLIQELSQRSHHLISTDIMIRGISELLRQPEFSELQQVQMLLHLLEEEQDQLYPVIFELPEPEPPAHRVMVRIGSENGLQPLNNCTLIAANYKQGNIPVGSVGIIGPTRMLYENAIALVESTADYLTDALS